MVINRPAEEVGAGKGNFAESETIGGAVTESFIHKPKSLTVEEANNHLQFGYYNSFASEDLRQLTGEAVIVYDDKDIVKIHSPSYEWRVNMRGNNPNINNQFYTLLNSVYPDVNNDDTWNALKSKLVVLPLYGEQSLKDLYAQSGAILTIPSGEVTRDNFANRDSRIHLLWMNYLLSLPPTVQGDALNILSQFKTDRNNVIEWLQTIEQTHKDIEKQEIPERAKGLISSSRRLARERMSGGNNYANNGSYMKLPLLIKSTLRNLINKENGTSLYGLVREMKASKVPKTVATVDETATKAEVVVETA
jgi:hypothetical protein